MCPAFFITFWLQTSCFDPLVKAIWDLHKLCFVFYQLRSGSSNGHRSLPELHLGHRGGQIIHEIKTSAANTV